VNTNSEVNKWRFEAIKKENPQNHACIHYLESVKPKIPPNALKERAAVEGGQIVFLFLATII
jgi:hypothetical protein